MKLFTSPTKEIIPEDINQFKKEVEKIKEYKELEIVSLRKENSLYEEKSLNQDNLIRELKLENTKLKERFLNDHAKIGKDKVKL